MRRRALIALAAAGAVVLLAFLAASRGGGDHPRDVPEGGSSFREAAGGGGGDTTLVDALAAVLAPPAVPNTAPVARNPGAAPHLRLPVARAAARLFLVGFAGTTTDAPFFANLRERGWGGVLLERGNYTEPGQLTALAASVTVTARDAGDGAPLVAAAQLGGEDSAFHGLPPAAQADAAAPAKARSEARRAGAQLKALTVNMTLAPSADIGDAGGAWEDRAYSDDPGLVARDVAAAVAAYRHEGIAPVVGHFPGEGGASQDPEAGAATVGLSVDDLKARDLHPFTAIARSAPAIQLSGAAYAGFDGATPATLLPETVELLRSTGFRGVVVSADLAAAAAATGESAGQAAVQALQAGCDVLVLPGDAAAQEEAWRAVVRAVRRGTVSRARVAGALERVAALKRRLGLT